MSSDSSEKPPTAPYRRRGDPKAAPRGELQSGIPSYLVQGAVLLALIAEPPPAGVKATFTLWDFNLQPIDSNRPRVTCRVTRRPPTLTRVATLVDLPTLEVTLITEL